MAIPRASQSKQMTGDKKKKKHDCASKVKHEQFGVGNCISEAHDLDENGNVAHYDVEFGKYILTSTIVFPRVKEGLAFLSILC